MSGTPAIDGSSDWEATTLGQLVTFKTGPFGSTLHQHDYIVGGVPIINPSHIRDGKLRPSANETVNNATALRLKEFRLSLGDIVMGRRGEMGRCALVRDAEAGWLCGSGSFILRNKADVDMSYLQRAISLTTSVTFLEQASIGSTMNNLNHDVLGSLPVNLPPRSEQTAIAEVLDDADESIVRLEALIAKKQDVKQSVLQQLLTGRTRLPGFSGEWKEARLGDHGLFSKGQGIKKDDVVEGGLPCIRYGQIYTDHNDWIRNFTAFITPATAQASRRLVRGELLFTGSGETAAEIGKCVAFLGGEEAYAGGDIVILTPRGVDSRFMGYALNAPAVVQQKMRLAQGDAVVHISASSLASLSVAVPPLEEQETIAGVLSDIDVELEAVVAQRDKARLVKQGMMQELLTGRVRLP